VICYVCKADKNALSGFDLNGKSICKECKSDFKVCPKCANKKHSTSFYCDRSRKDGRMVWCKSCSRKSKINAIFGQAKTKDFVFSRRKAEELSDIRSNSTDLDSYDI